MKHLRFLAFAMLCLGACTNTDNPAASLDIKPERADMLIRNVKLVSGERDAPSGPLDVLIDEGVIVEIGENLAAIADEIIEGTGAYLTPGLIDSHTHLFGVPGMTYEQIQAHPNVANSAMKQIPKAYLYHGFTTVIDVHGDARQIAEWNARETRPTAYFCGGAPVMDGYPMRYLPVPLRYQVTPYFLMGVDNEPPQGIDPNQHSPEAVVGRIKEDGAICVKTHHESGYGGNGNQPVPALELIQALVSAAHAQDLPVILHANSESAQQFGVEAGVDGFAHGMWTWNAREQVKLSQAITGLLDETISAGIAVQPTIQVLYGERDIHNPNYLSDPNLRAVLPQSLIDWYASEEGQQLRVRMTSIPYIANLLASNGWEALDAIGIERMNETLNYFSSNKGRLIFGSDTPSDLTYANPPGLNGRMEMTRWMEAGVTPQQFFMAATIENAKFFNLDDELGTIEVGKRADLLLLASHPLEAITAFDTIKVVISQGRAIERNRLSAHNNE